MRDTCNERKRKRDRGTVREEGGTLCQFALSFVMKKRAGDDGRQRL